MKAYQWLELRKGQTYTEDIKVMKLASMIKVGSNNALQVSVEFMKITYRSDFNQALTYITSRINELNANSRSSVATRQISSAQRQKKCNGVDISDPFRKFTSEEWHQLQQHGQGLVQQYRTDTQGGGRGGRGGRGRGRGGRGYYNNNNGGRGHGGFGRGGGRGGHYGGRSVRGGHGGRGRGNGDDRNVNQVQTDTKDNNKNSDDKKPDPSQSNGKGGNAGLSFSKWTN